MFNRCCIPFGCVQHTWYMVASPLIPLATSGRLQQLTDSPNSPSLPTSSHCFSFKLLAGITLRNKKTLKKHYLRLEFKTFIEESNEIFWTLSNVGSFPANKCSLSGQANIRNVLKEGVATNGGWTWLINEGTLPASKPELRLLNCYKNEMHCDKRFFRVLLRNTTWTASQPTRLTQASDQAVCC